MKKILLFAMGAMMSLASYAQEEDVTYYIQNAGFDSDLTWQADGSKKAIVDQSMTLSDRSIAGVAADSSVYALVNPSTPKHREDGRTTEATNGFIGRIQGWTVETNQTFPKCEWVYFGSIPYSLGETAIPIADDGSTYLTVPAKPAEFSEDDNIGFAYLRAGWGGSCVYKQVVKLPCAVYRLEYWTINNNPNGTNGKNLSKVICRKDTWEDQTGFTSTEWTKHEIEFTPTAEFTMQFGFESSGGSGSNPFLCIDGIKLWKIGEADRDDILHADINDLMAECQELAGRAAEGFTGLSSYIADYEFELEDGLAMGGDDLEDFLNQANRRMADVRLAVEEMDAVNAILAKMDNLLQTTDFPGKADFEAAYQRILGYKQNQPAEGVDVVAQILGAVAEANAAILAYYMSQADTASEENPADFTIFVQHPWFINSDAEPILQDGVWVFPNQIDPETGEDRYTEGSASSPDLNSDGWTVTGTYTGGDQRLNWQRGRSCWNAWGSGINGTIAVGQAISDLPNGYYTVSADLITQSGYLTDQHVYAQSSAEKKISATTLSIEGWDESMWETVSMTAAEKVLVVDGKLTIGAEGTGTGNASAGWFLATNFKLNFLGKASEEDVLAAIKTSFDKTVADAKEMAAGMHLAGDKKAFNDTIALYETAADKDAYLAAIEAIRNAQTEAQKSEAKYLDYLPAEAPEDISGKTLLWVKALLDGQEVEGHEAFGEAKPIAQFAYDYVMGWLACDTATYTKMDATVDLLKNYVNTYIPVYSEAVKVAAAAKETGKTYLQNVMTAHQQALTTEMKTAAQVNEFVAELKRVIVAVKKQNIYEEDGTDYTAYIQNPNAEAVDGWDIALGNGDGNGEKSGQWFDGSSTRYFDSYNSAGLKDLKISQLVKDLPNGTYMVGVYTRTPAEGAYIFAGVADTTFVEIPLDYYYDEAGDSMAVASDKYGPMWQEAEKKIVEEGMAEDDPMYAYYNAIYNANNAQGRGFKHQAIENIVVTNHELFLGTMCGTEASKTEKVFGGAWYSVGGWTLTLTAKGDNTGWEGPLASGVETVKANAAAIEGIYSLTGVRNGKLQRGLNIIVRNGKAQKVFVK
jgi:hypothetical protein